MAKNKYNEYDYACAVGRLRALETHLIGTAGYEKLLASQNSDEAVKILYTLGWKTAGSFDEMLMEELSNIFRLIEDMGGGEFLKTQRVKYDYHNLKVLVKVQLTKQVGDSLLIDLGNISAAVMKTAITNRDYSSLDETKQAAILAAYEQYARIADAQLVDIVLDAALFRELQTYANNQPENKVGALIKFQIDMHNIKTFIRVRKMGKSHGLIERVIGAGGNISPSFYIDNINAPPDSEADIFAATPYVGAFEHGKNLDLALDDLFNKKVYAMRGGAFGIAPLAAYFFIKENEIRNVRIILTCKNAGISEEIIRSRLRG